MIFNKELFDGIFDENSEEYNQLKECYELIVGTAPTISSECKTNMILYDHCRINLSTIYYMLCRNISKMKNDTQKTYDAQYMRLVKLGRPSNAAIEAEIRATCADYALACSKIEAYEQVKDLVSSYMRSIDSAKQTSVEILRDSRRLD